MMRAFHDTIGELIIRRLLVEGSRLAFFDSNFNCATLERQQHHSGASTRTVLMVQIDEYIIITNMDGQRHHNKVSGGR
jgi:hypothetical protein